MLASVSVSIIILLLIFLFNQKEFLWKKEFNFSGNYIKAKNGYIVYGIEEENDGNGYPRVVYINHEGDLIFNKKHDKLRASTVQVIETSRGIILVGLSGTPGVNTQPFILNMSKDGVIIHEEVFEFEHADIVDIKVLNNYLFITGNAYDKGYSEGNGGCNLYYIIMNINNGKTKIKEHRINKITSGGFVEKTAENHYIIMGQTKADSMDLYKLILNDKGEIIEEEIVKTEDHEYIQILKKISGRGFIISAILYEQDNNNHSCHLIFLDEKGKRVWERAYKNNTEAGIKYIIEDNEGFLIATSVFYSKHFYLAKISWQGDFLWQKKYDFPIRNIVYSQNINDEIIIVGNGKDKTPFKLTIGKNGEKIDFSLFKQLSNFTINNIIIEENVYLIGGYSNSQTNYKLIMK